MAHALPATTCCDGTPLTEVPRVLIVEDAKSVAEVLAMFFEMEGMKTAVAFDGVDAVGAAESFRPHLVFMDLAMPRMDGLEAARRIREVLPDVIIVALCGTASEESRRQTQAAGFVHHLVKPVAPDDLRRMVRQCLPGMAPRDADLTGTS